MYFFKNRKNKRWVWIAYHRSTKQVLDYEVGCRGYKTGRKLFERLESNYSIECYATDNWKVYHQVIPRDKHIIGKMYTQGIESLNSRIRHYLAGFARRSKDYFKSEQTMLGSLALLFWYSF
jgi:insertion element IS1 protein InsB